MYQRWVIFTRRAVAVPACDSQPLSKMPSSEKREDLQFQLLRLLEQYPEYSQRDVSRALGISLGKANYCLRALIDKGSVKIENFKNSSHKMGYLHVLTPQGVLERALMTNRFLNRKLAEYEALKSEIEELEREIRAQESDRSAPKSA